MAGVSYWGGLWPDYADGVASGGGGGGDATAPVITVTSTPTKDTDPFVISVYDNLGLFRLYQLTCRDGTGSPRLVVYDPGDGGFIHPFNGLSTLTGAGTSGSPYIFTVYRRGRWPTGIEINFFVRAIDTSGNQTTA